MNLTKTHYLAYLDAPRHLWAIAHDQAVQTQLDAFTNHLLNQGNQVQKLARQYIEQHLIPQEYGENTQYRLEETKIFNSFQARIDLIVRNPQTNKYDLYEIKSSSEAKTEHTKDLGFQKIVFEQYYKVGECYVLHLNKEYVREAKIIHLKQLEVKM